MRPVGVDSTAELGDDEFMPIQQNLYPWQVNNNSMTGEETGSYETPAVTEYGSVESITEEKNKATLGTDTDISAINLKGSTSF
jgi:hypothetical protein